VKLEDELRELFGGTKGASWPGEREGFDRFLRRRARRGRAVAAAAGLALVAVLGAAVLVARVLPEGRDTVAPAGGVVRVPEGGFELPVPAGWRVERELTATGPGRAGGAARPAVVGVVLVPGSGEPRGAAITVSTDDRRASFSATGQRSDGRPYQLRPGAGPGEVGQYVLLWPDYCPQRLRCGQQPSGRMRMLLVTGVAAPGDAAGSEQVRQVMRQVVDAVQPIITNALRPPAPPTVPADTKVLLGKGGSGAAAWEAWIEPIKGNTNSAGFGVHFPWADRHYPDQPKHLHWEQLEPEDLQRDGFYTLGDCLWWVPGSGLLLFGLADEAAATVRIELAGQRPVEVSTFGRDKPVPWVAFVSPPLPAGSKVERVTALDAAGKTIGIQKRRFGGERLCRSRAG
jgi:hypothetical protein